MGPQMAVEGPKKTCEATRELLKKHRSPRRADVVKRSVPRVPNGPIVKEHIDPHIEGRTKIDL